jgi:hypothetical protein
MDFGKAYTYITEDSNWIMKVVIGAAIYVLGGILLFIPILLLYGYQIAITRNVLNGEKNPLPEWSDFGQLFMDGLYIFIARFVYGLPALILLCLGLGGFLLPALGAGNEDVAAALAGVSFLGFGVMFCLILLYALIMAFVAPAINIQYIRTGGNFAACFRFGEVFGIVRANFVDILLVGLVAMGVTFVAQTIGSILAFTICGPFILNIGGLVWVLYANGYLYGQIAAKSDKFATGYA